ncbi:MAG: family 43 glycosylhydrolase [Clostridia bacterium]|nr:family 43 glycosylhydrolase [Clostridia bacterium]
MLYTNPDFGNFAKDPAVIELNGYYYLYHSIFDDPTLNIGISRSADGDSFERIAILPRTQECEQKGIGAPGAIVLDGVVHLFYQTYGNGKLDAICHASSTDGVNFVKDESNPILAPRAPWGEMPAWSCGRAIDADVCVFNGKLILYFATRDKEFKRQIVGAAWAPLTSDFSGGSWTLCPDIVLEPTLPWEQTCIEAPAALVRDGKVYLFYAGAYNCSPQLIGCAVSEDGFRFERLFVDEPLLRNGVPGSWNESESGHPYIYEANDGRIWLYYQGSPDKGKTWYLSRCEVGFADGKPYIK